MIKFRLSASVRAALISILSITFFHGESVFADTLAPIPGPPLVSLVDDNGVDLVSGDYQYSRQDVSIGGKDSGLSRVEDNVGADNYTGAIYNLNSDGGAIYPQSNGVQYYSVSLGRQSQKFSMNNGTFLAMVDGGRLSCGASECDYILKDGTSAKYRITQSVGGVAVKAILKSITKPDGEIITLTYPSGVNTEGKQSGVVSSLGWMIKYQASSEANQAYGVYNEIYGVNLSVQYCDPAANSCPGGSAPWPSVKFESGIRDKLGNLTKILSNTSYSPCNSGNYPCLLPEGCYPQINAPCPTIGPPLSPYYPFRKITSVQTPSGVKTEIGYSTDPLIEYTGDDGRMPDGGDQHWVSYVKKGTSTWTYQFETRSNDPTIPYNIQRTKAVDPSGGIRTVFYSTSPNVIPGVNSKSDQLNNAYKYSYEMTPSGFYQITTVARPDATWSGSTLTGGYTKYSYDTRGNVVEVREVARSGSGLADSVIQASYDSSCANDKICNKPNWVIDARGGQTDFEYSPVHGQIVKETAPATASGTRPQKRYSYTLLYPRVKDAGGTLVNSTPVYRLTGISTCKSATSSNPASCVGTAEEIKTSYSYNSDNLLLTSQTQALGDGSEATTTNFAYDNIGNRIVVDGPRTDVDDRSYTTYDALRRPVFEIGASPDGTKPRLITKHNYDSDGREYLTQSGTGMATDGTDFAVDRFVRRTYDSVSGLLIKTEVGQP